MSKPLSRTVLHDWHESHGGKMVDFAGWSMPVQYATGIIAEHLATRRGAGLFDVSHMGRYRVTGPGAERFLLRTLTNNASGLDPSRRSTRSSPTRRAERSTTRTSTGSPPRTSCWSSTRGIGPRTGSGSAGTCPNAVRA